MKSACGLSVVITAAQALAQPCAPIWSSQFRPLDVDPWPSTGTSINGAAVFDDDGPGPHLPALYVSGNFSTFGGSTGGPGIARWNGSRWDPVGTGAIGGGDLVVCDDDGPDRTLRLSTPSAASTTRPPSSSGMASNGPP
jgi:hypothetical protein